MKTGQTEVKSKGKIVGTAEFAIYEAVEEAKTELGDEQLLELLNNQVRTRALNAAREASREHVGKKMIRAKAFAAITPEEFMEVAGDPVRINQLLSKKEKEVEAEMIEAGATEAAAE